MDEIFARLDNLYLEGNQQKIEGFLLDEIAELEIFQAMDVVNILAFPDDTYYRDTEREILRKAEEKGYRPEEIREVADWMEDWLVRRSTGYCINKGIKVQTLREYGTLGTA